MTHDSIGLGEDGPTHQPIEQLASLRAMPGLLVIRPADANEVTEAYKVVLRSRRHPAILSMTRQAVPTFDRTRYGAASGLQKGAYVLADAEGGKPEILLMATERGAADRRGLRAPEGRGIRARAVSMPCWELFERQSPSTEFVLPAAVKARWRWSRPRPSAGIATLARRERSSPCELRRLRLITSAAPFRFTTDHAVAAAKAQLGKDKS
jgi:transketolase